MNPDEFLGDLLVHVYCRIQPSPISGVGVFAIRKILKGINPLAESRATEFLTIPRKRIDALPDDAIKKLVLDMCPENDGEIEVPAYSLNEIGISYYLNHSTTPNMSTNDGGDFYALRDIEPGEELLVDYGTYGALNL